MEKSIKQFTSLLQQGNLRCRNGRRLDSLRYETHVEVYNGYDGK